MKSKVGLIIGVGLVLALGLIFRFYRLTDFPVSLTIDEVNIGYNAYSILKTGQDEWGIPFPLAFKSVGDYKPPVAVYLTVPSIAIFGLTEFAVRFPMALFGLLTVLVLILLLRRLGFTYLVSCLAGMALAISPWQVHFSRAGFEAILALFFLLFGTWLFLVWVDKKRLIILLVSLISFSLSVWSYHAERVFVPLFCLALFGLLRKKINFGPRTGFGKQLLLGLAVVLVFAIPFARLALFTPAIKTRAQSTSIISEPSLGRILHRGEYSNLEQKLFDNDAYLIFRHWAGKYLNYFDLRFWFWRGMQFSHPGYPDLGLFYLVDLPILFFGFYQLVQSKGNLLAKKIAWLWFFLGPLPASFAMNDQHPLRALVWYPAFGLLFAFGWQFLLGVTKKLRLVLVTTYCLGLIFNLIYAGDIYFNQFPRLMSEFWHYGFEEIGRYVCENQNRYDQIIISETFGSQGPLITGIPYAYFLFYCQYDPVKFLKNDRGIGPKGESQLFSIDNVLFRRIDWKRDRNRKNTLLVSAPWDLPPEQIEDETIAKKIFFKNGQLGFLLVETGLSKNE